jgi:hypothetical protein
MFIENVWCFGDKDLDLFRYSRKATLDEFLEAQDTDISIK